MQHGAATTPAAPEADHLFPIPMPGIIWYHRADVVANVRANVRANVVGRASSAVRLGPAGA